MSFSPPFGHSASPFWPARRIRRAKTLSQYSNPGDVSLVRSCLPVLRFWGHWCAAWKWQRAPLESIRRNSHLFTRTQMLLSAGLRLGRRRCSSPGLPTVLGCSRGSRLSNRLPRAVTSVRNLQQPRSARISALPWASPHRLFPSGFVERNFASGVVAHL